LLLLLEVLNSIGLASYIGRSVELWRATSTLSAMIAG